MTPKKKTAAQKAAPSKGEIKKFYVKDRTGQFEYDRGEFIAYVADEIGQPRKVATKFIDTMLAGKSWVDGLDDEASAQDRKNWIANEKRFETIMDTHEGILAEVAEAEQEAAAEAERTQKALAILPAKGHATALALRDSFLEATQQAIGDKFVVTDHGLKPVDGETVSEIEIMEAVAMLANASEGLNNMRGTTLWQLGDAVLLAEGLNEGAKMVAQIVEITGNQKHTVTQAARLCAYFKDEERMPELTFTHHQEIFNYREAIKPAAMKKIIAIVLKGEERTIVNEDGKKITQNRPLSCGKMRDMFKAYLEKLKKPEPEKSSDDEGEEGEEGGGEPVATFEAGDEGGGHLYLDTDNNLFSSADFNQEAYDLCALHIDLSEMTVNGDPIPVLNKKKGAWPASLAAEVEPLPAEEEEEEEEDEDEIPG